MLTLTTDWAGFAPVAAITWARPKPTGKRWRCFQISEQLIMPWH